ncbi:MAG: DUF971 family protein [Gammaproteobacteria bacterium]|jgi:DUF971 family protein
MTPTSINYHAKSRVLEVGFEDGKQFSMSAEYLRVYSPSAEVRGHGLAEPKLVPDKQEVVIASIDPIGNYAVRLRFDDGHDTGLYTWELLYDLGLNFAANWDTYQRRLSEAGHQPGGSSSPSTALNVTKYSP